MELPMTEGMISLSMVVDQFSKTMHIVLLEEETST